MERKQLLLFSFFSFFLSLFLCLKFLDEKITNLIISDCRIRINMFDFTSFHRLTHSHQSLSLSLDQSNDRIDQVL